jgi:hypothetical protein
LRRFISLLVAVAVTMAPFGAAVAAKSVHQAATAVSSQQPPCPGHAKHHGAPVKVQKSCCCDDAKAPCQDAACMAKCFKLIGKIDGQRQDASAVAAALTFFDPQKPPNRHPEPLPRPPQA